MFQFKIYLLNHSIKIYNLKFKIDNQRHKKIGIQRIFYAKSVDGHSPLERMKHQRRSNIAAGRYIPLILSHNAK